MNNYYPYNLYPEFTILNNKGYLLTSVYTTNNTKERSTKMAKPNEHIPQPKTNSTRPQARSPAGQ
jgi:hypothetical protein